MCFTLKEKMGGYVALGGKKINLAIIYKHFIRISLLEEEEKKKL